MTVGLIVHQLTGELADIYKRRIPAGLRFEALPEDAIWSPPPEAEVMVAHQAPLGGVAAKNLDRPPGWPGNLKWLHLRTTGLDDYPPWIYDVPLVTTSRGQYVAIAEYVIAAMLMQEKQIPGIFVMSGPQDWKLWRLGTLERKVLGIVGVGTLGRALIERARAFGMTILASRRTQKPVDMEGVRVVPFQQLIAQADHLVVAAPLTSATRHLFNARVFAAMKRGAHLINVARGGLVDDAALREALDAGHLAAATIDVSDPEPAPAGHWFYSHPKVRFSPHISFSSPMTQERMISFFFDNLERYRHGDIAGMQGKVDKNERY